jgi:hypothetical protein
LEQSSGNASPAIPLTRVEKVDDEPRYGEVPGTEPYRMRESDAEPDIITVDSTDADATPTLRISTTPGGKPIPTTLVEKIDPSTPSHGEVPGTLAHEKRAADAVPDMVIASGDRSPSIRARSRAPSTPGDLPIPITKVEKVDSEPSHGEVPGTKAFELRRGDAQPDLVEQIGDLPGMICSNPHPSERLTESGSPTSHGARSPTLTHSRRKTPGAGSKALAGSHGAGADGDEEDEFGDDFDEFEEGEDDAEFGDFDDGFQEAQIAATQSLPISASLVSRMYTPLFFPIF